MDSGLPEIPGYEILEEIGSGSYGNVYKARQVSMDRLVAVKVLPSRLASDKRYIERFFREARAVAKLNHPNIVTGIDVGEAEGCFYFVMEYIDGESASVRLDEEGAFSEREALDIIFQIAQALRAASSGGIIHRDIKPANILLSSTGIAKLADLGVARRAGTVPEAAGPNVIGTPYYMSPEQACGEDLDIRSDIYSLGATLYHFLTGRPPFHGLPPAEVMERHVSEEPEPVRALNPRVSVPAARLVEKMMAKDQEERPADPADLLADVKRTRAGRMPRGTGTATGARAGRLPSRGAVTTAAVVGALLVGGFLLFLLGSGGRPDYGPALPREVSRPAVVVTPEEPSMPAAAPEVEGRAEGERAAVVVDMEQVAQEALRAVPEGKGEGAALRVIIERFPGTTAARGALERLREREDTSRAERRAREIDKQASELRARAEKLFSGGRYGEALNAVDPAPFTGGIHDALVPIRAQMTDKVRSEVAQAVLAVMRLTGESKFDEAKKVLDRFNVEGAAPLPEEFRSRLAAASVALEEAEAAHLRALEAARLKAAEEAYASLTKALKPDLRELAYGSVFERLVEASRKPLFGPVKRRLLDQAKHVKRLSRFKASALGGARRLEGQERLVVLRDGTQMTGVIVGVKGENIEVERRMKRLGGALITTIPLAKFADKEIVSLAMADMDPDDPNTHVALAVFWASMGDGENGRKHLEKARRMGAKVESVEQIWFARVEAEEKKLAAAQAEEEKAPQEDMAAALEELRELGRSGAWPEVWSRENPFYAKFSPLPEFAKRAIEIDLFFREAAVRSEFPAETLPSSLVPFKLSGRVLVVRRDTPHNPPYQFVKIKDAIASVKDGDVIEIQDPGPFGAVKLGAGSEASFYVLRGATGMKPVLRYGPDGPALDFRGRYLVVDNLAITGYKNVPILCRDPEAGLLAHNCVFERGAVTIQREGVFLHCTFTRGWIRGTVATRRLVSRNNAFTQSGYTYVDLPAGTKVDADYNAYGKPYQRLTMLRRLGATGAHNVQDDLRFVSYMTGDLRLDWDSPHRGRGADKKDPGAYQHPVTEPPSRAKDLAALFSGQAKQGSGGRVSITYDFSDPAALEDWSVPVLFGKFPRVPGKPARDGLPMNGEFTLLHKAVFLGQVAIEAHFKLGKARGDLELWALASGGPGGERRYGLLSRQDATTLYKDPGAGWDPEQLAQGKPLPFGPSGAGRALLSVGGGRLVAAVGPVVLQADDRSIARGRVGLAFGDQEDGRLVQVKITGRLDPRWAGWEAYWRAEEEAAVEAVKKLNPALRPGLAAVYFGDKGMEKKLGQRVDRSIDHYWPRDPDLDEDEDDFTVRWTGVLYVPRTARYLLCDGFVHGCRIEIDKTLVHNRFGWRASADLARPTPVRLQAGLHDLGVSFIQRGGDCCACLDWRSPDFPRSRVRPAFLWHLPAEGKKGKESKKSNEGREGRATGRGRGSGRRGRGRNR